MKETSKATNLKAPDKNLSNVDESSWKQSFFNFAHDEFTGYFLKKLEFVREELKFENYVIDCLFKIVSVLRDERFSSCKSGCTEIVSEKLVDKSVDPCENPLVVINSTGYFHRMMIIIILEAKKTNLMTSIFLMR